MCSSDLICSCSESELRSAATYIGQGLNVKVEWMVTDMADRAQVDSLAAEALRRLGRVDVLVNNAGSNVPQPVDEITDEVWDRILELNLSSCMRLTRALVPQMKARRWGRIIHISGIGPYIGTDPPKGMAKMGLVGFTRGIAREFAPWNKIGRAHV